MAIGLINYAESGRCTGKRQRVTLHYAPWFLKLFFRAFQTAQTYFSPQHIFFLGDLFDEGLWCPPAEFDYYVKRCHNNCYGLTMNCFQISLPVPIGQRDSNTCFTWKPWHGLSLCPQSLFRQKVQDSIQDESCAVEGDELSQQSLHKNYFVPLRWSTMSHLWWSTAWPSRAMAVSYANLLLKPSKGWRRFSIRPWNLYYTKNIWIFQNNILILCRNSMTSPHQSYSPTSRFTGSLTRSAPSRTKLLLMKRRFSSEKGTESCCSLNHGCWHTALTFAGGNV